MIRIFARALAALALVISLAHSAQAQVPHHDFRYGPLPPLPEIPPTFGQPQQLIHYGLPWGGAGFGLNPQQTSNLPSPLPHPWWGLPGSGISMHHPPHFDVMYGTNWLGLPVSPQSQAVGAIVGFPRHWPPLPIWDLMHHTNLFGINPSLSFDPRMWSPWLGMPGASAGTVGMTNPVAAPSAYAGYPGMMPYVVVPYPVPVALGSAAETANGGQPVLCDINQVTLLARTVDDCETAGGDVQPAPGSAAAPGADGAPSDSGAAGPDQSN